MIEQTRFLSIAFFCSEFKLENIYPEVHFLRIAGKIANKIRTRKNFVPHGCHLIYKLFSNSYLFT